MLNFLQFIFFGIPSTKSYEAKLQDEETKYTVYLEATESDDLRRYNELNQYFADPSNLKIGTDLPEKERQLEQEYQAKIRTLKEKKSQLSKEFRSKKALQPQKELQLKRALQKKWHLATSKEERKSLKVEKVRLKKQIAMERHHLKEERALLKHETKTERQKLKKTFQLAKKQLIMDIQQQKDELQQLKHEFKRLANSKLIRDYFSFIKKYSKLIAEQEQWVLKFYENFAKSELGSRWSNTQMVSELLMNGAPYSPIEDLHIFSPDNIQQTGGLLKVNIKQENKQGLAWDKIYGLVPKTFFYTSGMLSSANSFNQMYGKFEAKVHVKYNYGTYHAFWMGTTTKKPHLNIFKFEGKNLVVSAYTNDTQIERKLKYRLKDDFYIYALIWNNEKLVWQINGKKVFESPNIIDEPMYISFSSGVYDQKAEPTAMYVDWIRCFRSN
ncbi:MAG: family 16 glycosylhydrolase [Prevotellaceae bacterium]|jgi:hypothetical protein|nr:family 16 glycosylhydrolase [Prevotellaceae bacterium]